jgi:hypothetical protein
MLNRTPPMTIIADPPAVARIARSAETLEYPMKASNFHRGNDGDASSEANTTAFSALHKSGHGTTKHIMSPATISLALGYADDHRSNHFAP